MYYFLWQIFSRPIWLHYIFNHNFHGNHCWQALQVIHSWHIPHCPLPQGTGLQLFQCPAFWRSSFPQFLHQFLSSPYVLSENLSIYEQQCCISLSSKVSHFSFQSHDRFPYSWNKLNYVQIIYLRENGIWKAEPMLQDSSVLFSPGHLQLLLRLE